MKKRIYLSLALAALSVMAFAQVLLVEKSSGDKLELPLENIAEMRFKTNSEVYPDQTPECVEIVDLGLSVNWASVNLGATLPEEPGYLVSWGETEEKDWYSWSYYKFGTSKSALTKYTTTDELSVLQSEDDAATMLWGGDWRIPSREEWQELIDNCEIDYAATENGYPGVRLTSKVAGFEGKSIFLAAAGWIQDEYHMSDVMLSSYWTNKCCIFPGEMSLPDFAFAAEFWREGEYANKVYLSGVYRYQGRPIRAVVPKEKADADGMITSFVVEHIDGSTQKYVMTDEPKISFDEENVWIKTQLIETSFAQKDVAKFYFEQIVGVDEMLDDTTIFYYDGRNIIVEGKSCIIVISDMNGRICYNATLEDGRNVIDMSGYEAGIYIAKVNNQTIKILKK